MVKYNPVEMPKADLEPICWAGGGTFEHFVALSCLTVSQVCAGSRINLVILNFCSWLDVSPASQPAWVDTAAALNRES